jgi:hypothetical protein
MGKVVESLLAGKETLKGELEQVDHAISTVTGTGDGRDNPAVKMLLSGRAQLQAVMDELDQTMERIRRIMARETSPEQAGEKSPKPVIPGQYSGMKLSTAVQAYLSERGRGPIACVKIVEDMISGGLEIERRRSKQRGLPPKKPDTRDIRLLAANNKRRFRYDRTSDTVQLVPSPGNDTSWVRRPPKPTPTQ